MGSKRGGLRSNGKVWWEFSFLKDELAFLKHWVELQAWGVWRVSKAGDELAFLLVSKLDNFPFTDFNGLAGGKVSKLGHFPLNGDKWIGWNARKLVEIL